MGKAIVDISMSLDGFVAGANDNAENGLGDGGERLHDWVFDSATQAFKTSPASDELFNTTGAIIAGRRVYDIVGGWGGSHPIQGAPLFVLTHHVPENVPQGNTPFTFVTNGIDSALSQAKAAAGDKDVYILGGANIIQQYLKAGLVDELRLHIAPVLLGEGVRLFNHLDSQPIELQCFSVIEAPDTTHLKLRVIK